MAKLQLKTPLVKRKFVLKASIEVEMPVDASFNPNDFKLVVNKVWGQVDFGVSKKKTKPKGETIDMSECEDNEEEQLF